MVTARDVDEAVVLLYSQNKQPVSIAEVANNLGVTVQAIEKYVKAHLCQGILAGDASALEPGPAMGLI